MKPCLDDDGLLQLYLADASEYPAHRAHSVECSSCAGRLQEVAREAGTITSALAHAANHLNYRSSARANVFARIGDGFRTMVVFSGAAAFGGAAAFAVILALGWRPVVAGNHLAQATTVSAAGVVAPAGGVTAASQMIASNNMDSADDNALPGTGALYSAEAVSGDPLAGLMDDASTSAANSDDDDDMLFCVPGDDGSMCSNSSGGQQG